jgi:hypothetical protein
VNGVSISACHEENRLSMATLPDGYRPRPAGEPTVAPRPELNETTAFDAHLAAQEHSLGELRSLPEFKLIEAIDALYDRSVRVLAPNPPPDLFQLLVACRRALLSAAATIGRGSPADALVSTRRGIEAACLAVAINHDPANREKWVGAERRLSRWADRRKGVKPKQPSKSVVYPASPLVESLRAKLEIISDAGIHFTPTFLSMQRWRVERAHDPAQRGPALVRFASSETSQRELERALMFLASVHLEILDVFVGCFDGVFYRDAEWLRIRRGIVRQARLLVKPFRSEGGK